MRLRAIIIDDEQKGIDALKILIERYVPDVHVVAESTNVADAIKLVENYLPEIVFLDINMPELDGFELLEKLEPKSFNLVFVTAHQEYALRALKANAVDFLLKPVDHEDLLQTTNRIKRLASDNKTNLSHLQIDYAGLFTQLNRLNRCKIMISTKTDVEYINAAEIISLESQSNYTQIYLEGPRSIIASKTLREFEQQLCLPGQNFMRVHHSYVINLTKIMRYMKAEENIIMCNGQKIPIARSKKESFHKWLHI